MEPSEIAKATIEQYVDDSYWSTETMISSFQVYADKYPSKIACSDSLENFNWRQLHNVTDDLASNLIDLGLARDERVLVQIPSSSKEIVLRIALQKAGLLGVFVPLQWRKKELSYVMKRVEPSLVVLSCLHSEFDIAETLVWIYSQNSSLRFFAKIDGKPKKNWLSWENLINQNHTGSNLLEIENRCFDYDEISLITASSGTSGMAKLCEWPDAAQRCVGKGIGKRLQISAEDRIGLFAPMSGAAGLLAWTVSATVPCEYIFPKNYRAEYLLRLIESEKITVVTTVPVILARLVQEPLESYNLNSLRALRVGTAAINTQVAISFEKRTGCKVIPASGSMECPGFGHADIEETMKERLNGSVGFPLPGCEIRIKDKINTEKKYQIGELEVSAPYASSGYWKDRTLSKKVWSNGWFSTGDICLIDENGRLTLLGRKNEVINRSGLKILPYEIEHEISKYSDVSECAVIKKKDAEYGEVPYAYVTLIKNKSLDTQELKKFLLSQGLATYKIPDQILQVSDFPRVAGNKIDKNKLIEMTRKNF